MTWVAVEQRLELAKVVLVVPAGMEIVALEPTRNAVRDVCEALLTKAMCIAVWLTVVGVHVSFA